MTAWFQDLPLDFTREDTRRAERLLITAYPMNMATLTLAQDAGLDLAQVNQQAPVKFLVRDILVKARQSDRLVQLLAEVLRDPGQEAIQGELWRLVAGHEASIAAYAMKRKPSLATLATLPPSMEVWGPEEREAQPLAANFEKTINAAAGFEEPAVLRRRLAEAEVRTARVDIGGKAEGTGFLVSNRHLLTNWHVVKGLAHGAVARFDHKQSPEGSEADPGRAVAFATDWCAAHSPHEVVKIEVGADGPAEGSWDFALVRLAEPVGSQAIGSDPEANSEKRGHYDLDGSPYEFDEAEPLRIVGHPQGRPMQLSWASPSQVRRTKHLSRLRYHTNTEAGSSGSPVFNRDWRIVALHHAAGPTSIPGEFHLKTGEFNQGIPMSSIVAELKKQLAGTSELKELGLE